MKLTREYLAKFLGWRYDKDGDHRGCLWIDPKGEYRSEPTDYLNNLNSIMDEVRKLDQDTWWVWHDKLQSLSAGIRKAREAKANLVAEALVFAIKKHVNNFP